MQPHIPTPATFVFIIMTDPYLGGVISPSRLLGTHTTAPKQPDIPTKLPVSLSCFQADKVTTTNTHTSHI